MQLELTLFEEWRPVVGWEGLYEVSDHGRVRSLARVVHHRTGRLHPHTGRVLSPNRHPAGYVMVLLSDGGRRAKRKIHQLVLEAFVGLRAPGEDCRHLNGAPDDNRLVNLRWGTRRENSADKLQHGTDNRGDRCPTRKLCAAQVAEIRGLLGTASHAALAARYGVSRATISLLAERRTWAHVP